MSSITIAPAPLGTPVTVASSGSDLRLTRRGRVVLTLAFLMLAGVLMTAFGGLATATREEGAQQPVRIIEVVAGDTLFGIAGDLAEPGRVRETVSEIQRLNSLSGGELQIGQRLAVPIG